jgi:hypothetical protein
MKPVATATATMTSGIQVRDSTLKISNPLTGRHFLFADGRRADRLPFSHN